MSRLANIYSRAISSRHTMRTKSHTAASLLHHRCQSHQAQCMRPSNVHAGPLAIATHDTSSTTADTSAPTQPTAASRHHRSLRAPHKTGLQEAQWMVLHVIAKHVAAALSRLPSNNHL
jgi:hypothetical protein